MELKMSSKSFNLNNFRLKPSLWRTYIATQPERPNSTSSQPCESWFIKGPIPGEWLSIAAELPGKSLHVGLAIWFQKGLTKCNSIKVTNKTRKKFSLLRDAYLRGLEELEKAGLVGVERKQGACAKITIHTNPRMPSQAKDFP